MNHKLTKPNPIKTVTVSTVMNEKVYKVFTDSEWKIFQDTGKFGGSADDLRDGFIHLSTKDQLAGVVESFFSGKRPLYVAAFSDLELIQSLTWEEPDSNEIYPHLYNRDLLAYEVESFFKWSSRQ